MSYFIYTDLICSFLDPKLVDPGSTLIHVGAYTALSVLKITTLLRNFCCIKSRILQGAESVALALSDFHK